MKQLFLFGILFLSPQLVCAAGETAATESLFIPALKMIGALAVVVGLLLLFYAASRKGFGILPRSRDGQIKMMETRALGGKKFLCLVKVRDQELLLGVSHDRIECLTRFERADETFAATLDQLDKLESPAVQEPAS